MVSRWDATDPNNSSKVLETKYGYNNAGLPTFTRDPLSHQNFFSYTDSFSDSVNRNTFAYPTTITDADGYQSFAQYNYDFGATTQHDDANYGSAFLAGRGNVSSARRYDAPQSSLFFRARRYRLFVVFLLHR